MWLFNSNLSIQSAPGGQFTGTWLSFLQFLTYTLQFEHFFYEYEANRRLVRIILTPSQRFKLYKQFELNTFPFQISTTTKRIKFGSSPVASAKTSSNCLFTLNSTFILEICYFQPTTTCSLHTFDPSVQCLTHSLVSSLTQPQRPPSIFLLPLILCNSVVAPSPL